MFKILCAALLISLNLACAVSPPGGGTGGSAGGGTGGSTGGGAGGSAGGGTGGGSGGGTSSDAGVAGVEFLSALAGLWSGPATMTRLGVFPQMNFDFRPVDGQFVFGQSELDSANTLRFGFSIETNQGRDVVAYRNGGYFMGMLRDSRTVMVEADAGSWRFCSVTDAGCSYIDARFSVAGAQLSLDTKVKGMTHLIWSAQRVETRTLPAGFPTDLTSRGDGSAPWPTNATVKIDASWSNTLAGPADVWVLLTTTPCFPSFGCKVSRSIMTSVLAGAQSASLSLPNVHPGAYKVTVLLDVDRNFAALRAPNTGDRIAVDLDLTVPATGTVTLPASASFSVP